MDKTAIKKHVIYNKLIRFSDKDLNELDRYIDFLLYKNKIEKKAPIKLEGILKNYDIDFSDLKTYKQDTWKHLEQEFPDE